MEASATTPATPGPNGVVEDSEYPSGVEGVEFQYISVEWSGVWRPPEWRGG